MAINGYNFTNIDMRQMVLLVIFALNDMHDMCLNKILKCSVGRCQSKGLNWSLVFHVAN